MTDKKACPIGMFDSGLGGLTVMQQIIKTLPHESIVYFGDTARVPYGGKGKETIIRYSIENTIFLLEKQIKLLVIPCNTASSTALPKMQQIFNIPIIGVIEPGAEKAVSVTRNGHIAILGTKGTIQSGAYQKEIKRRLPEAVLYPIECPLFVPLVEENFLEHPATRLIIREYLKALKGKKIDTLLLGCTHYPIMQKLIQEEVGHDIMLVDSATTCADQVALLLKQNSLEAPLGSAEYHYFVSDDPGKFQISAQQIFGHPINQVEISHEIYKK